MAYRTITQRCATIVQDEARCGTGKTIKPGYLVEFWSDGGVKALCAHRIAGGNASPIFAIEDELQGKDTADSYTAGKNVPVRTFRSGDLVAALVPTGQTITIGMKLESVGDGTLTEYGVSTPSGGELDAWVASSEVDVVTTAEQLVLVRIR